MGWGTGIVSERVCALTFVQDHQVNDGVLFGHKKPLLSKQADLKITWATLEMDQRFNQTALMTKHLPSVYIGCYGDGCFWSFWRSLCHSDQNVVINRPLSVRIVLLSGELAVGDQHKLID